MNENKEPMSVNAVAALITSRRQKGFRPIKRTKKNAKNQPAANAAKGIPNTILV